MVILPFHRRGPALQGNRRRDRSANLIRVRDIPSDPSRTCFNYPVYNDSGTNSWQPRPTLNFIRRVQVVNLPALAIVLSIIFLVVLVILVNLACLVASRPHYWQYRWGVPHDIQRIWHRMPSRYSYSTRPIHIENTWMGALFTNFMHPSRYALASCKGAPPNQV